MLWIYLALAAYFFNALVFIIDKHLLTGRIPKQNAYAFGVAILSSFALVLIPFGVSWQSKDYIIISLLFGISAFLGLICTYKAMKESDVSIAVTQVGTVLAVATYVFSVFILGDALPLFNLVAIILLIIGMVLLGKLAKHILLMAVLAGILSAFSVILLKITFDLSDFINGLFWTRMGFVVTALSSLALPKMRREIKSTYNQAARRSKLIFVFNKVLATIGFVLLYLSIRLGKVAIVNALLGVQFMFVFILALAFKNKISGIGEKMSKSIFAYKLIGITFVLIGLALLFK